MKHHTFEMLRVFAKVWYTAMINGNCIVKHGVMSCCLLCATTSMLDFLLAMTFQSFCLSQSIPVMDFQYWSCKSWVSVLVLDIKVLVLVLKLLSLGLGLEPQSLGLGLGLGTSESWSWSWRSKSWIQVCHTLSHTPTTVIRIFNHLIFLCWLNLLEEMRSSKQKVHKFFRQ